jgi:hypothetical protein
MFDQFSSDFKAIVVIQTELDTKKKEISINTYLQRRDL